MPEITEGAKKLTTLLDGVVCRLTGDIRDVAVTAIETDSRKVGPGCLFIAVSGGKVDGHDYIRHAVDNGCAAVVVEKRQELEFGPPVVAVEDSRKALAEIALSFYDNPGKDLVLVGITGTNGKTTTAYLVEAIISASGGNPGVIGTVNYRFNGEEFPAPFTTPEPVILQKLLRDMVRGGVTHLVMEVSSHSLVLKRIHGLKFDVALFTNLSRDHLDFHETMGAYFEAKKQLFLSHVKRNGKALIFCEKGSAAEKDQLDWGGKLVEELRQGKRRGVFGEDVGVFSCGFGQGHDLYLKTFSSGLQGIEAEVYFQGETLKLQSSLVGEFNLKNIMTAVGAGLALGLKKEAICKGIAVLKNVPGRLERVMYSGLAAGEQYGEMPQEPYVFVDFAHTPDALRNVLETIARFAPKRVIVLFGCGGDRDPGKRFPMGETAGRLADVVVITSDNSRSESPELIMAEIERGVVHAGPARKSADPSERSNGYVLIGDRAEAIKFAVSNAQAGDVVLLAGKGHENYQITGKNKVFFDDRIEAKKQLDRLYKQAA